MELNFHSTYEHSEHPVNGHFPKVRRTEVILKKDDGSEVKTSTVCNPHDQDRKVVGQKFAVKKLTQKFDSKEFRRKIWNTFRHSSKKREKVMA